MRSATAADRTDIHLLLGQLHGEGMSRSTLPQLRQESNTLLAVDADVTIGLAVATFVDYGIEAYGMIEELVVDSSRRGERIGTALVDQCRSWLGGLGAKVIFVSALVDAEAFYLKLGFQRCTGPWFGINTGLIYSRPGRKADRSQW
ncbi:MAG TPA: GNAT family N-acetyltransferase [Mycobacteriales bacterium]|nr:GNAT family N-acetyltransferase [Mycobacteriales bacterium]